MEEDFPMTRTATLAGMLLVGALVLAAPAKQQQQIAVAAVYKTPQEVYDALFDAMEKSQARAMVGCLTPEAQKKFAIDSALYGIRLHALQGDEKAKALLTKSRPLLDVMAKHGVDEKAAKALAVKGKAPTAAERDAILKAIKDPVAFSVDYAAADFAVNPRAKEDVQKLKLEGVKVEGDKATAYVVVGKVKEKVKVKEGDREVEKEVERDAKQPFEFERIDGSWRIDPAVEPEEGPTTTTEAPK
jgi:hypothetical protein